MSSIKSDDDSQLRRARFLGIIFLAYAIVLIFIVLLIPEVELPASTGPIEVLSWLMVFLMPIEIVLIHLSYNHLGKKPELTNIMGPSVLMYTFASVPSVYAFVIGFVGSNLRPIAIPLGLVFTFIGFWLALMYSSNLWEKIKTSNQETIIT
ncbi:MAG: hypothetical protein ACFFEK_17030 [Candidatus Thorarchaeota archaeon]